MRESVREGGVFQAFLNQGNTVISPESMKHYKLNKIKLKDR